MKRIVKIISGIIVVAAILLVVLLIKSRRPEPLVLAELRLKGYETNASQQKVAVFELKNPGPIAVDYSLYEEYEEVAGKSHNTPVLGELDGHSTNILRMMLSERPTRLMLSCESRQTLRNLGHEILGLIGKRPSTSGEYGLWSDNLTK